MKNNQRAKYKILLFLFFFLNTITLLQAQNCPDIYVEIRSQQQVDDFAKNYPGCTTINGTIRINPDVSEIYNLHGLSQLKTIKGDLIIFRCFDLEDLDGLENLDSIYGTLAIDLNEVLTDISGVSNLKYLGGTFQMHNNILLQSIDTFNFLSSIGGLSIAASSQLTDISGLHKLRKISGALVFWDNRRLKDLTPLNKIDSIGQLLSIVNNDSLADLQGLQSLTFIGKNLYLASNDLFIDLTGLENLTTIVGEIRISSHPNLASLEALSGVNVDSVESLVIMNNAALSVCSTSFICNLIGALNELPDIRNNAPGCNTFFEVYTSCGLQLECLPGFIFRKQSEIDYFPVLFPNCREIYGDVIIRDTEGDTITSLEGLVQINRIYGTLEISGTSIKNISGFRNLEILEGSFGVSSNDSLVNLNGLENLSLVKGLSIHNNNYLISLEGLQNIGRVNGFVYIAFNNRLPNFRGLENLEVVTGECQFGGLKSLEGLSRIDSINGLLSISSMNSISNLSGLESLHYIGGLSIQDNSKIISLEGLTVEEIGGYVFLRENPLLENLSGLENVHTIKGSLQIEHNDTLVDLKKLSNLSSVGTIKINYNKLLQNLDGLQKLFAINGSLDVSSNDMLTSLNGLENIVQINGEIRLSYNDKLSDIQAIRNIDPASVKSSSNHIEISDNPELSECALQNICVLLDSEMTKSHIYSNGPGCVSRAEILTNCIVSVANTSNGYSILIYPNPATGNIYFKTSEEKSFSTVMLYDLVGRKVLHLPYHDNIPLHDLINGLYTIVFTSTNNETYVQKIMILN